MSNPRRKSVDLRAAAIAAALTATASLAVLPGVSLGSSAGAAPTCPRYLPERLTSNPWAATKRMLAPAGADAIVLCRYVKDRRATSFAHAIVLAHPTVTLRTPAQVNGLVRQLNALPSPSYTGARSCAADNGSRIRVTLLYARHPPLQISVVTTGCQGIGSSHITRNASKPAYRLERRFQELTGLTGEQLI